MFDYKSFTKAVLAGAITGSECKQIRILLEKLEAMEKLRTYVASDGTIVDLISIAKQTLKEKEAVKDHNDSCTS